MSVRSREWYRLKLGDPMLADALRDEIAGVASVHGVELYSRHEGEGQLHCELVLYFKDDAVGMAEVQSWLAFAANEMWAGAAIARAIKKFKRDADPATAIANTKAALKVLDDWLADREWLACGRPTVADIAVYPYAAMAWEGDIDMSPYKNLDVWIKRIEALPGYIGMENMPRPD